VWGSEPSHGAEPAIHVEDWTLECWIKRLGNGSGQHQLLGVRNTPTLDHAQRIEIAFEDVSSNNLRISVKGQSDGQPYTFNSVASVAAGSGWLHLLFTFNDTTDQLQVYTNGAPHQAVTAASSIDFDSTREMKRLSLFDAFAPETGRRFNGYFGVFRLYDRVLNATEVAGNFETGNYPIDSVDPPGPGDWIPELLDTTIVTGTVINVSGPPSTGRDTCTTANSVASVTPPDEFAQGDPRRGLPDRAGQLDDHSEPLRGPPHHRLPDPAAVRHADHGQCLHSGDYPGRF
jgi:hypothetical protein